MVEGGVAEEWWRNGRGGTKEMLVVGVCNLVGGELEFIDPDTVDGFFAVLDKHIDQHVATGITAH